jgi:uncharacterized protein (TIGR02466 family)
MSVDLFFGAPLIVKDVDQKLRETIRAKVMTYLASENARRDVALSPEESVATSFYRPEASILVDAKLDELEALIFSTARNYLEKTLKLPPRRLEIEQAWINVFEPGAQEHQHTHDGSLLSCSYYVEAPEECGCIVFPDPITARRSYREFTKTTGQELLTRSDMAVEPQPGRMVMFESWMPHYVQCNKSDKVRISIAINLRGIPETTAAGNAGSQATAVPADESAESETTQKSAGTDGTIPDGKPFLFNELFEVNPKASAILEPIQDAIPTIVIDDFLKDPEKAREIIGRTPATNWKHEQGGRNFIDYYDCRLRFPIRHPNLIVSAAQRAIHKVYGINTRPADPSVDVNWFRQIHQKRADFAVPHADMTENVTRSFTCVLFLNRIAECSGGTAFFRFKPSNSLVFDEAYARAVTEDSRFAETGLDYWPEETADAWERVGVIDMLPGRLLIFPSQYFHSAYHPKDSFFDFPRLTLAYWMIS